MLQLPGWTGLKDVLAANGWAVQLKAFSCPACGLSGPLGPLVPYFPSLAMLELSFNQLSGVIPPDLGGYRGLRYLSLSHNKMYGAGGVNGAARGASACGLPLQLAHACSPGWLLAAVPCSMVTACPTCHRLSMQARCRLGWWARSALNLCTGLTCHKTC